MMITTKHLLQKVARLYNVQTAYFDISGRLAESPKEAILAVLRMLGAPVERLEDLAAALRERRQFLWRRGIDPVVIAWNGGPARVKIRVPSHLAESTAHYQVRLENGDTREGICHNDTSIAPAPRQVEDLSYVARRVILPETLPLGYHRLRLELGGRTFEAFLFASPLEAFVADPPARHWGLFCPLYALRSEKSWGIGSFYDLRNFGGIVAQFGGHVAGALPLLAAFLDEPFDPSPYAPVSRLFWNELYLDVTRIPELHGCPAAGTIVHSSAFQAELKNLRDTPLVEYRRAMALKRRVLEALARSMESQPEQRRTLFQDFIAGRSEAEDYAAFRAKMERERKSWAEWPAASRDGRLGAGEYDEAAKRYHLYVQWQADEQMRTLQARATADGPALYLDFPLGVNRDGYDPWRERDIFALSASGGAPPDDFFNKGQDWGFPPLRPESLRAQGYLYYIRCLRHHLAYAGMLRIDHVMGLHRLYWVPRGFAPSEGVYVRYPAEEFYAALNLESHRHRAEIVGENLGTVPPYVNAAMAKHKIHGMIVGQFCVGTDPNNAFVQIPDGAVASLNTHDTPTFAGFWHEKDIDDRVALGLLTGEEIDRERRRRALQRKALVAYLKSRGRLSDEEPQDAAVLRAWLSDLAQLDASLLLVNLEDLWLEMAPQNVPGTWEERPNWKRKIRFPFEWIPAMQSVTNVLKEIDEIRKERR
ncbi:MAG TPA: 4-alpha-glucanotransferase [Candidatus Binatia bacterium]|nr:4-alpha-glucanotransferase [Candidatus Binatia bacterium]